MAGGPGCRMLDAALDDLPDDFSPGYSLSFAGIDRDGARACFADVCAGRRAAEAIDRSARPCIAFDATRRREQRCH